MNEQTMREGDSELFPAHILSFFAQINNSQQNGASAANAEAAKQSGATNPVSIISFHQGINSRLHAHANEQETQCARVACPLAFHHFRCKNKFKQNKASAGNADAIQTIRDVKTTRVISLS